MRINLFGNTLLVIAALLYAAHNIAAAMYAGPSSTLSFQEGYKAVGYGLDVWAWIALIIGFLSITRNLWLRLWQALNDTGEESPAESPAPSDTSG